MKPRKKGNLGRKIGDAIQDVKQDIRSMKGQRKIKRSMEDSSNKSAKIVRDRRGERRATLEGVADNKKWKKTRFSDEEIDSASEKGVGIKRKFTVAPTGAAKRAKRTLGRMDNSDSRRLKRSLK